MDCHLLTTDLKKGGERDGEVMHFKANFKISRLEGPLDVAGWITEQ